MFVNRYNHGILNVFFDDLYETVDTNDCDVRLLTPRAKNNNKCKECFLRWFGLRINTYIHYYAHL